MRKTKIYLAGKIAPNGWRQAIINIRKEFCGYIKYDFKHILVPYNDDIYITGPYFLSCDHSCYHGEGSHGLGLRAPNGCYGEKTLKEEEVVDICKAQIKNSDILFAYIDDDTCYGTLFEIGYAHALGKKIIIVFDTEIRKQRMWFISQNADYSTTKEEFDACMINPLLEERKYIYDNEYLKLKEISTEFIVEINAYLDRQKH